MATATDYVFNDPVTNITFESRVFNDYIVDDINGTAIPDTQQEHVPDVISAKIVNQIIGGFVGILMAHQFTTKIQANVDEMRTHFTHSNGIMTYTVIEMIDEQKYEHKVTLTHKNINDVPSSSSSLLTKLNVMNKSDILQNMNSYIDLRLRKMLELGPGDYNTIGTEMRKACQNRISSLRDTDHVDEIAELNALIPMKCIMLELLKYVYTFAFVPKSDNPDKMLKFDINTARDFHDIPNDQSFSLLFNGLGESRALTYAIYSGENSTEENNIHKSINDVNNNIELSTKIMELVKRILEPQTIADDIVKKNISNLVSPDALLPYHVAVKTITLDVPQSTDEREVLMYSDNPTNVDVVIKLKPKKIDIINHDKFYDNAKLKNADASARLLFDALLNNVNNIILPPNQNIINGPLTVINTSLTALNVDVDNSINRNAVITALETAEKTYKSIIDVINTIDINNILITDAFNKVPVGAEYYDMIITVIGVIFGLRDTLSEREDVLIAAINAAANAIIPHNVKPADEMRMYAILKQSIKYITQVGSVVDAYFPLYRSVVTDTDVSTNIENIFKCHNMCIVLSYRQMRILLPNTINDNIVASLTRAQVFNVNQNILKATAYKKLFNDLAYNYTAQVMPDFNDNNTINVITSADKRGLLTLTSTTYDGPLQLTKVQQDFLDAPLRAVDYINILTVVSKYINACNALSDDDMININTAVESGVKLNAVQYVVCTHSFNHKMHGTLLHKHESFRAELKIISMTSINTDALTAKLLDIGIRQTDIDIPWPAVNPLGKDLNNIRRFAYNASMTLLNKHSKNNSETYTRTRAQNSNNFNTIDNYTVNVNNDAVSLTGMLWQFSVTTYSDDPTRTTSMYNMMPKQPFNNIIRYTDTALNGTLPQSVEVKKMGLTTILNTFDGIIGKTANRDHLLSPVLLSISTVEAIKGLEYETIDAIKNNIQDENNAIQAILNANINVITINNDDMPKLLDIVDGVYLKTVDKHLINIMEMLLKIVNTNTNTVIDYLPFYKISRSVHSMICIAHVKNIEYVKYIKNGINTTVLNKITIKNNIKDEIARLTRYINNTTNRGMIYKQNLPDDYIKSLIKKARLFSAMKAYTGALEIQYNFDDLVIKTQDAMGYIYGTRQVMNKLLYTPQPQPQPQPQLTDTNDVISKYVSNTILTTNTQQGLEDMYALNTAVEAAQYQVDIAKGKHIFDAAFLSDLNIIKLYIRVKQLPFGSNILYRNENGDAVLSRLFSINKTGTQSNMPNDEVVYEYSDRQMHTSGTVVLATTEQIKGFFRLVTSFDDERTKDTLAIVTKNKRSEPEVKIIKFPLRYRKYAKELDRWNIYCTYSDIVNIILTNKYNVHEIVNTNGVIKGNITNMNNTDKANAVEILSNSMIFDGYDKENETHILWKKMIEYLIIYIITDGYTKSFDIVAQQQELIDARNVENSGTIGTDIDITDIRKQLLVTDESNRKGSAIQRRITLRARINETVAKMNDADDMTTVVYSPLLGRNSINLVGNTSEPYIDSYKIKRLITGYERVIIHYKRSMLAEQDELRKYARKKVTLMSHKTGAGKSTVLPLMMLEALRFYRFIPSRVRNGVTTDEHLYPIASGVIVTEPKVRNVVETAGFITKAFGFEHPGYVVGYTHGHDSVTSPESVLNFYTEGVLIKKVSRRMLRDNIIMFDEIHEASTDIEALLAVVKHSYYQCSMVLLISATFDTDKFKKYYNGDVVISRDEENKTVVRDEHMLDNYTAFENAVALSDKETTITINTFFTDTDVGYDEEHLKKMLETDNVVVYMNNYTIIKSVLARFRGTNNIIFSLSGDIHHQRFVDINHSDNINPSLFITDRLLDYIDTLASHVPYFTTLAYSMFNYIYSLLKYINMNQAYKGHIIVFMDGIAPIRTVKALLETLPKEYNYKILILTGSSGVVPIKQGEELYNKTIIYLATNAVESGVTIPGAVYVIDTLFVKQSVFDPFTKTKYVFRVPCSKFASLQRRGRVGRSVSGYYFPMVSQNTYKAITTDETPAKILTQDYLTSLPRLTGLADKGLLDRNDFALLNPPPTEMVASALEDMQDYGIVPFNNMSKVLVNVDNYGTYTPVHAMFMRMAITNECGFAMAKIVAVLQSELYNDTMFQTLMLKVPDETYVSDYLFALNGIEEIEKMLKLSNDDLITISSEYKPYVKYVSDLKRITDASNIKHAYLTQNRVDLRRRIVSTICQVLARRQYVRDTTLIDQYTRNGHRYVVNSHDLYLKHISNTVVHTHTIPGYLRGSARNYSSKLLATEQTFPYFIDHDRRLSVYLPDIIVTSEITEAFVTGLRKNILIPSLNMITEYIF